MKLFLPVLLGTTRQARMSVHAATLVHKIGSEYKNVQTQLIDPGEFNFPFDGEDEVNKDPKYTEITKKADGFFIVTPEYNHGYPGSLKRMLDSELKNYIHKPVAMAGVSSGPWGGVRVIENLTPVVRELGLVATFTDVQFPKVKELFDKDGKLLDENYVKRVKRAWDELIWMATALKNARK